MRPVIFGWPVVLAAACVACSSDASLIEKVEAFRAARDAGRYDDARVYLASDPRVWFESRDGEGTPMKDGAGPYKAWDEHFNSNGEQGPWTVDGRTVWAIATESNDYYRLVERDDTPTYRITYFFNEDRLIEGYMISDAYPGQPSPPKVSREDEFEAWAAATHADEWSYLRPDGKLDPTGDRAGRTRALLELWRAAVGLPPIEPDVSADR